MEQAKRDNLVQVMTNLIKLEIEVEPPFSDPRTGDWNYGSVRTLLEMVDYPQEKWDLDFWDVDGFEESYCASVIAERIVGALVPDNTDDVIRSLGIATNWIRQRGHSDEDPRIWQHALKSAHEADKACRENKGYSMDQVV